MLHKKSVVRRSAYKIYQAFNQGIAYTDVLASRNLTTNCPWPPLFIIGAPRSGSTLLYQSLVTAYQLGYLSNLHCWFYGAPWLVESIFHPSTRYREQSFTSRLGTVRGKYAPSECAAFWYRFFPRWPHRISLDDLSDKKIKHLKRSILLLISFAQKPFIFKNLHCSVRLEPLYTAFPDALFVVMNRQIKDIAHSLLKSRKKKFGNYKTWFSVDPSPDASLRSLPIEEQVVEQAKEIYRYIEEQKNQYDSHRFLNISYESFCNNPQSELKRFWSFCQEHNVTLHSKSSLPDSFPTVNNIQIDEHLYERLTRYIQNH